jgi:hypothetical protein
MSIGQWTFFGDTPPGGATFGESTAYVIVGSKSLTVSKDTSNTAGFTRALAWTSTSGATCGRIRTLVKSNQNFNAQSYGLFAVVQSSLSLANNCYNALLFGNGAAGGMYLRKGSLDGNTAPSGGTHGQVGSFNFAATFATNTVYAVGLEYQLDADYSGACALSLLYDPNPVASPSTYTYSTMVAGYQWTDFLTPLTLPGVGIGIFVSPGGSLGASVATSFDQTEVTFT